MMLSANLDGEVECCHNAEMKGPKSEGKESLAKSPSRRLSSLILSILTGEDQGDTDRCGSASQKLVKYLAGLSPDERSELVDNLQVQHYLHRLVQHAGKNDIYDEIIRKLSEYFPSEIKDYQEKELPVSYSYSDVEPSITSGQSKTVRTSITVQPSPKTDIYHYDPGTLAATFRAPKLTLENLRRASVAVSLEVRTLEKSVCGIDISPAKRSMSVGWYGLKNTPTRLSPSGVLKQPSRVKSPVEKTELVPILGSELHDPHFRVSKSGKSLFPQKQQECLSLHTSPINACGRPLKTAFDVIEAFASGQLRAESESVYLNYTHSDRCSPYDLSVTLKTKAMPEHFVISNFGIIHVYPDGMSDFQTFADWLREASMFTLMRQIPFFREYKLKKALRQWHKAVKSARMHRLSFKINKISIRFFPIYADALLKLKHLSEELLTISFHHLKPLGGYTVDAMEHSLQGSQTKAQQFLLKYFKYCRRIVCGAVDLSRKHAGDLEAEHHQQHFVPEVPLSIQRKRHEKLERDLEAATYQKDRIGDFVYLAEQVVYSSLLQLARDSAKSWKELFLCPIPKQASSGFQIRMPRKGTETTTTNRKPSEQKQGDYFLLSSLVINSSGKVATEPQSFEIKHLFTTFFHNMSEIVIFSVHQLDLPMRASVMSRVSTRDTSTCLSNVQMPLLETSQQMASRQSNKEHKRRFQDIPPSLAPAKQPKSVLKALKAIPHDGKFSFSHTVQDQELASQTARNMLGMVEMLDMNATAVEPVIKRKSSVLCRPNFMDRMHNDEQLQLVLKEVELASEKVAQQMESICLEYKWLGTVWQFSRMWKDDQWDVWEFIRGWSRSQRGAGSPEEEEYNNIKLADEFEVTLNQLYRWRNQFVAFPAEILTPYAMLCISSSSLVEMFCSTLNSVQDEIKSAAIKRSRLLCKKVLEETKHRSEVLSAKRYDLEGFAEYAHYLRESHAFQSREYNNITFVLKVHSILQCQGIQVPQQDKELGRELHLVWQVFEQKLAEADFFVAKQTPIKAQGLQESIMSSEEELSTLVEKVYLGEFIDPTQDPTHLIELLDRIREEVGAVHSRLLGLSKWKEAITGLPHDLSNVNSLLDQIYVRQELWKYRRHFDLHEKDWMNAAFKKLDINSISTRVSDWLDVCTKLEETLGWRDPVLNEWRGRLTKLKKGLPLLLQLSSNYLRTSHWVTIFASLGEDYDPTRQYTMMDFALYNIHDHTNIIFEICYDAMQGEKLKSKIREIQQELESLKINVIQIPLECYPFALPTGTPTSAAQNQKISFQPGTRGKEVTISDPAPRKGTTFAGLASPSDGISRYLYKIENSSEILMKLENGAIQLKIYLASPHIGGLRQKVDVALDTVSKLQESVHLLVECQKQWENLLSVLKQIKPRLHEMNLTELQKAGVKFQDITKSIRIDPRLLSLMEKRRGQKGFRELQGEALRNLCNSIRELLGSAMLSVKDLLAKGIEEFPRLCYLTEKELLTVVANRGDPMPVIPIIRKIFPGVSNIRFTEVTSSKNTLSLAVTTTSSEEEGFQILFVRGLDKEQLPLCVPLTLGKKSAPEWLGGLEYAISYSLASALSETYSALPALLKGLEVLTEQQAVELLQWLGKHLNQCVLLSMELHWTLVLHSALTSDEPIEQLKMASSKLSSAVESVSEVLLRRGEKCHLRSTSFILQHLILMLRRKSEMALSLIAEDICTPESFNWRAQIQYSTETESLYVLPQPTRRMTLTLGIDYTASSSTYSNHGGSRHNVMSLKGHSPVPPLSAKLMQDSNSLVASSRSLLSSRNALLANASSINELNRSRSVAGCPTPLKCFVHCHRTTLPYGFEFLGSNTHLVLTPQTESSLLSLVSAVVSHAYPSVNSASCHSGTSTTGRDVAVVLGRHLYTVDCCLLTDAAALRCVLFGALHTGSLLQLDNLHHLPHLLMIQLAKWLETVTKALAKIPPFMTKRPRETAMGGHISSMRSTPAHTHRHSISGEASSARPPEHTSLNPQPPVRSVVTPTSSVLSQQSSRLLNLMDHTHTRASSRATTRLDWYQMSQDCRLEDTDLSNWCGYGGVMRRPVEIADSEVLCVSPAFGCILVADTAACFVPEQLKASFRPVEMLQPNWTYLCEALLVSHGFGPARELGVIISEFLRQLQHQLLSSAPDVSASIGPSTIARLVSHAAELLQGSDGASRLGFNMESRYIASSVLHFFAPQLAVGKGGNEEEEEEEEEELSGAHPRVSSTGWNKLRELLSSFFPSCDTDYTYPSNTYPVSTELVDAIQTQLRERHLQRLPSLMEKIKQLHLGLQHSRCVLLSGPCGSGKTTCFKVLATAYQQIREVQALANQSKKILNQDDSGDDFKYPTVSITFLNPGSYSMDELLGSEKEICHDGQSTYHMWYDGVLTAYLRGIRHSEETRATTLHPDGRSMLQSLASTGTPIKHWLVLDGAVGPLLSELLYHLTTDKGVTLKNGDKLCLPNSCQLIVESPSMDHVTPSLLSSSSLVHCSRDTLSFNAVVNTWLDKAPTQHNLSAISAETLAIMIRQLLPETLEYLSQTNTKHCGEVYAMWSGSQVYGLTETQCFLSLLSAVLERNAPKEEVGLSHRGTGSYGSRGSSVMSESRASSVMMSYSTTSMQTEASYEPFDYQSSKHSMQPLEEDNMSELSNLDTELALSLQVQMAAMLSFAYIWSLGAFVPHSESQSFSELARELIMQLPYAVPLPEDGSVFDYFLDLKMYHFIPWDERKESKRSSGGGGYVALPELERFAYIADLYVSYGCDVLLTGDRGTGRSSFVNNLLKNRLSISQLPINYLSTPVQLQSNVLDKLGQLEKKSGQRYLGGSKKSQRSVFFLDDIHFAPESSSSDVNQLSSGLDYPVLELLRYMLSHRRLTDFARACEHLLSARFVATSTPEAYWRLPVRLTRGMCRLPFLPPSDQCLHQIFCSNVSLWLEDFPLQDTGQVADAVSAASVAVYRSVSERLRPSSLRPHYLITMHDLLNVFEGLLLLSSDTKAQTRPQFGFLNRRGFQSSSQGRKTPQKKSSKLKSARKSVSVKKSSKKRSNKRDDQVSEGDSTLRMLIRLWCHETTRVYLDRNPDSKERMWFLKLLETCIKYSFCGVRFEENVGIRDRGGFRQGGGGHTASIGIRRAARGSRARGGALPQGVADGLNEEELAGNGVKVGTLKKLLLRTPREGEDGPASVETEHPPKLISLEQVTVRGEDLTGLIFAQFPNPDVPEPRAPSGSSLSSVESSPRPSEVAPPNSSGDYTELGDGQVMEVLSKHLEKFQSRQAGGGDVEEEEGDGEPRGGHASSITLYRDAIEHCARLYRLMNLPGASGLLLGTKGSGRKTLVRLMAHIKRSKVIELDRGSQVSCKQNLREACISAAVDNHHTLLLVSNHSQLSFSDWDNIITIMEQGLCPGLFTSSELLVMSGKLQAGKMKRTAQIAYQAFSRAVSARLHVLVMWDVDSISGSLFASASTHGKDVLSYETSLRALFQALRRSCSYIDHYLPWSKHAYSEIAMQWWQKESSAIKWQEWADTSSQLEAISSLAAHVHITTCELLIQTYGELSRHLVSPRLFTQCLTVTQNIATKLKQEEMVSVGRLQAALRKLQSVDRVVVDLEYQLSILRPQLETAEHEVQQKMELITAAKERYMEANRRCKIAEETIEFETTNVKELSDMVEQKLAEVEPVYQASLEALSAVTLNETLEVASYRAPPALLHPLFNALCMLFDRQESWEECQQLMMAHSFQDSLKFFDRDHLSKQKVVRLERIIEETRGFKGVGCASKAALPLGMWLNALLDYHKVTVAVEPLKAKLKLAEETLINARKTFVEMQKDMFETKGALESTIKKHKESIKKARIVENEINGVVSKLEDAQNIVNTMSAQRRQWEEQLNVISSRINSVPGHAMLCAAGVCYLSRAPPDRHKDLLTNWLGYCSGAVPLGSLALEQNKLQSAQGYGAFSGQQQVVRIQKDFSLATGLSEKQERATWHQESTFPDGSILDRFLSSRAFCTLGFTSWPLVFDPYDQFKIYLKAPEGHCVVLKASDPSVVGQLKTAMLKGRTVLLYVDESDHTNTYSHEERAFLAKLLQRQFIEEKGGLFLSLPDNSSTPVHRSLQIYMVIRGTIKGAIKPDGDITLSPFLNELDIQSSLDGSIVDVELKNKALENMLQKFVISHERPEYLISFKSLLTDLSLHEQALEASQVAMLEYTLDPANESLLLAEDLLGMIRKSEASEMTAREQIREAKMNLHVSEQHAVPYRPLSHYASVMLSSIHRVTSAVQYFDLGVEEFKNVLSGTIRQFKDIKVPDHAMSIKAHVIHLKNQLLLNVYQKLQMHVFERHQLLIPLLVALNMQRDQAQMTDRELELLGKGLGGVEAQLDLAGDTKTNLAAKPQWITDKAWCKALELQKEVPALRRLAIELSDTSTEWKEYFEMNPSIMAPLPGFGANCTLSQKMLLWKTFKPEKFNAVTKEFILVTSGGDFIKTKLPSFDEILSQTEPRSPTLLLQSPDCPDSSPVVAELRRRAVQQELEFRQYSLHSEERCGQLLESLPATSASPCWVIIEHCHLLPNCHEVLTALIKKLVSLEVHCLFRVWVMLSAEFVSRHHIAGYKSVISQESKTSDEAKLSSQLLCDLNSVLCGNIQTAAKYQGVWTGYNSTISKLRSFIPAVLSQSELRELDPQHSIPHSLPALIYEELCLHNQSTVFLFASLQRASSYLENRSLLSITIGQTILSIAGDVIPMSWTHRLPKPLGHMTSLMSAVKLLKARMEFYRRTLNSGTLPSKLNPLLFSAPQNLISSRICTFAAECQLSISSVVMEAKLQSADLVENQPHRLVLFGLTLQHATWDTSQACLTPQDGGVWTDKDSYCAVISYKVQDKSCASTPVPAKRKVESFPVYDCPVLLANKNMGDSGLGTSRQSPPSCLLFKVPLPVSAQVSTSSTCTGVCLLCDSELHDAYM